MNQRSILVGSSARKLLARSVARTARAVVLSMGPQKRSVLREFGADRTETMIDGLGIANGVVDEQGPASVAPRIFKEALWDARRQLGDGSCRVACMAAAVYAVAARRVASGIDPGALRRCMSDAGRELIRLLGEQRREHAHPFDIALSACFDAEIARAVAEHGADGGLLEVAEGWHEGLRKETVEGFCLDVSREVVGLSAEEQGARLGFDAPSILVVNEIIDDFGPLARILDGFAQHRKPLVIVARGFVGAARVTLTQTRASLALPLIGLTPSAVGERAIELLIDLAAATGATVVGEEFGSTLAHVRPAMLGRARQVSVSDGRAVFSGGAADEATLTARVGFVQVEIAAARHLEGDREFLLRRAARLAGVWSELQVGGSDDAHTQRRVRAAKVALAALEAARARGVVAGAGKALEAAASRLPETVCAQLNGHAEEVRHAAVEALCAGCCAVARQLASNAGVERAEHHVADDVVDPLSTTEELLARAISVASTLLSVEVLLC